LYLEYIKHYACANILIYYHPACIQ